MKALIDLWWLSFCRHEIQKESKWHTFQKWLYTELNKRLSNYIKILSNMLPSDAISVKLLLYFINFGTLFLLQQVLHAYFMPNRYSLHEKMLPWAERGTQGMKQNFPPVCYNTDGGSVKGVNALYWGPNFNTDFFPSTVNNGLAYHDFLPPCIVERHTTAGYDSANQERGFWYCYVRSLLRSVRN